MTGVTYIRQSQINTATLTCVKPGQRHYYQANGDSRIYSFLTPPSRGGASARPFNKEILPEGHKAATSTAPQLTIGLLGDQGQSVVSKALMDAVAGSSQV
jgi:hypothetical protein